MNKNIEKSHFVDITPNYQIPADVYANLHGINALVRQTTNKQKNPQIITKRHFDNQYVDAGNGYFVPKGIARQYEIDF